jgi:hypothetical protein
MLSGLTIEKAEALAKRVVNLPTAADVARLLHEELDGIL